MFVAETLVIIACFVHGGGKQPALQIKCNFIYRHIILVGYYWMILGGYLILLYDAIVTQKHKYIPYLQAGKGSVV